ncbi:Blue copper protein [Linum grandiflorum]
MTNLSSLFAVFVAIVACIPSPALAKDFLVGDNHGWTINFDYQAWAYGKDFRVGDRLTASRGLAMTSGNDVVTLLTPGRKWYICGKPNHCSAYNQKLVIVVKPNAGAWAPAPSPSLASGKDFIVGDNYGWTINFDYQSWAKDKEFHVGDRLIFKYPMGVHNVYKANGTEFQNCEVPFASKALITGTDTVILSKGKHYYICGYYGRCGSGQKLAVDVKG